MYMYERLSDLPNFHQIKKLLRVVLVHQATLSCLIDGPCLVIILVSNYRLQINE